MQKKTAARYAALTLAIQSANEGQRKSIVETLRRDDKRPADGVERRAARRALTGTFVGAFEQGREWLAHGRYSEAVSVWTLAVLIRPDSAEACYGLAAASAGAGDKRGALEALQQAVSNGFRDAERVEHEAAFDRIRKDSKFAALMRAMKP